MRWLSTILEVTDYCVNYNSPWLCGLYWLSGVALLFAWIGIERLLINILPYGLCQICDKQKYIVEQLFIVFLGYFPW